MRLVRIAKHLLIPDWWAHRVFPKPVLQHITEAVSASEKSHRGELCFVIEGDLDLPVLLRGMNPRARAEALFAQMGVWDTEENNGVLIYVQLIDRAIEIVADRGINAKVPKAQWDKICAHMQSCFHSGHYQQGALDGIESVDALLRTHFPASGENPDELPNSAVVL
ncbi:MAG: TPM domain-containing protein [Burkholderiales bacterium]|jgi:uncharacterized membrane protein